VDQIEINVVCAEVSEAVFAGFAGFAGASVGVPELGGDEDLLARQARIADRTTN